MKNMNWLLIVCFLGSSMKLCGGSLRKDIEQSDHDSQAVAHSRKRRYVVFPEGSTLTIAACVTPITLTSAPNIFTNGIAWAISYDLPNETIHTKDNRYDFPMSIRRHKRDLFTRMEKLMDWAGMDGKNCVLKTICETAQQLLPRQGVLQEILRLLFTYPPEDEPKHSRLVSKVYMEAHQAGNTNENCNSLFPCPISLLEIGLGFGKYPQTLF